MGLSIALTGATGFVGQATLPLLLAAGHAVRALVRNPSASLFDSRVELVKGDIQNAAAAQALVQGVDVVLHVAGVVAGTRRADFFGPNLAGSETLVKAALAAGVKHFVHVSSLAAREPALNHYAASKAAAETFLATLSGCMGVTVLRPAAVYGPGDKATLPLLKGLLSAIAVIPGTAAQRFDMVHVEDVAKALLAAAETQKPGLFHITDGSGGHDWDEILAIVRRAFGTPSRVVYLPRGLAFAVGALGDGLALLRGRPSMVNTGQLKQLYHPDWVVREKHWPLDTPVPLALGLPQTIGWYQARGLLPQRPSTDTSHATPPV